MCELLILFLLLVTGQVLGPFALTQEEIVERRHQLLDREQNVSVQAGVYSCLEDSLLCLIHSDTEIFTCIIYPSSHTFHYCDLFYL